MGVVGQATMAGLALLWPERAFFPSLVRLLGEVECGDGVPPSSMIATSGKRYVVDREEVMVLPPGRGFAQLSPWAGQA